MRTVSLGSCAERQTYSVLSVILGRAIKNEHLALGTLGATGLITWLSMGGKKKEATGPGGAPQTLQQVKDSVKVEASSRCVPCPR